jgi:methyl-accepting chemotaxis protein
MLNNTKIGPKLIGGFAIASLITLVVGLMGLRGVTILNEGDDRLYGSGVVGMERLAKANIAFLRNRSRIQNMIRINTPEYTSSGEKAIEKYMNEISENMTEFEKTIPTEDIRGFFKEFTDNHPAFLKDLDEIREKLKAGNADEAIKVFDRVDTQSWELEKQAMLKLMDSTVAAAHTQMEMNDAVYKKTRRTMVGLNIFSLIAAMGMGFFLTRSIVDPLQRGLSMMRDLTKGHLQSRMKLSRQDEIGQLADSMDLFADDLRDNVIGSMSKISAGDLSVNVTAKDDQDEISPAINKTAIALRALIAEFKTLTTAALEGHLSTRSDASKFQGGYREIVQGVNGTLDAVIKPVQDAATVLERVAQKDLTARVLGDYQGDHARIKNAVNQAAETLDQSLQQVAVGADQIASASGQIGTGAQALAQGTSEQASSLEEVSSSLQEMTAMTRQNSANAKEARGIAEATKTSAENGVGSMQRLSAAMDLIKKSSDDTAKIIKTIDEIAFQTNLLALNAAVEAARAGEAGKGFAVVAEEVRNLAMRSAEAAKNTANMIEGSVKNSENGVVINHEVMKNLEEINGHAKRVSEVMAEIAAASDQQSQGVGQVNTAMEQMNQLTQQNAANSEESASASEELSAQAQEMRAMVSSFIISGGGHSTPVPNNRKIAVSSTKSTPPKMASKIKTSSEDAFPLDTSSNGHEAFKDF